MKNNNWIYTNYLNRFVWYKVLNYASFYRDLKLVRAEIITKWYEVHEYMLIHHIIQDN